MPTTFTAPAATPESSVDAELPIETSAPMMTSSNLQTTKVQHEDDLPKETHKSTNDPTSDPGSSNIASSSAKDIQEPTLAAPKPDHNTQADHSEGVAAIASMLLSQGAQASGVGSEQAVSATDPTNGVPEATSVAIELHTDTQAASQSVAAIASMLLSQGAQTSDASGEQLVSIEAGQEPTTGQRLNGGIETESSDLSVETSTVNHGTMATSATGGVIAGSTSVAHADPLLDSSSGRSSVAKGVQSGSTNVGVLPSVIGADIMPGGTVATTDPHAIGIEDATALFTLDPLEHIPTTGASVVVAGETLTAVQSGADVLIAGTQLTVGQVATIANTRISVAKDGIVIGSSTASFHELLGSTGNDIHTTTAGDTEPFTSDIAHQTHAAGRLIKTLSEGGPAATIHGQVVTNGPDGVSLIDPAGTAISISAMGSAYPVIIIDGTTYTASAVSGDPSAVILQAQTSSIHDLDGTTADQNPPTISTQTSIAGSSSKASDGTSESASFTSDGGSDSAQQGTAAPVEESFASDFRHASWSPLALVVVLLSALSYI